MKSHIQKFMVKYIHIHIIKNIGIFNNNIR